LLLGNLQQDPGALAGDKRFGFAESIDDGGVGHGLVKVGGAHVFLKFGAQDEGGEAEEDTSLNAVVAGRAQAVLPVFGLEGVEQFLGGARAGQRVPPPRLSNVEIRPLLCTVRLRPVGSAGVPAR
jgi:hypothetical protein